MAITTCFHPLIFVLRKNRPKAMATNTYRIEMLAADALGCTCASPDSEKPLKVPATMSANAAMTSKVNSQLNRKEQLPAGKMTDMILDELSHRFAM